MDEHKFKQRIVGAIVLVALAVIFIPMLLSGKRDDVFRDFEEVIPPKPDALRDIKVLELDKPIAPPPPRDVVVTPVDEATPPAPPPAKPKPLPDSPRDKTPAAADTGSAPVKKAPAKPAPASKPAATAWAVQVGSFAKRANAMGLRDRLRKAGYRAYVEKVSTAKGVVYRVRVGPEVSRARAEARRKAIAGKLNLKGIVVSHP